jgi:hypothetical protein
MARRKDRDIRRELTNPYQGAIGEEYEDIFKSKMCNIGS